MFESTGWLEQAAISKACYKSSEQHAAKVVGTICKQFDCQAEVKFK